MRSYLSLISISTKSKKKTKPHDGTVHCDRGLSGNSSVQYD